MSNKSKLNLGCGTDIKKDCINLDQWKFKGVDVVHNINKFPFPFKNNSFKEIYCNHILEHVDDVFAVMNELWRISQPNALIYIEVPHFSGLTAVTDPSHKHFFSSASFDFFEKGKLKNYFNEHSKINFKVLETKIIYSDNPFLKIFNPIVNFNKKLYERFFAYIFPSQTLNFKLQVIK